VHVVEKEDKEILLILFATRTSRCLKRVAAAKKPNPKRSSSLNELLSCRAPISRMWWMLRVHLSLRRTQACSCKWNPGRIFSFDRSNF